MNHADLATSPRLQRALAVLRARRGRWTSTRTLLREANICAVNSVVAELRENGVRIECEQRTQKGLHRRRWFYRIKDEGKPT